MGSGYVRGGEGERLSGRGKGAKCDGKGGIRCDGKGGGRARCDGKRWRKVGWKRGG